MLGITARAERSGDLFEVVAEDLGDQVSRGGVDVALFPVLAGEALERLERLPAADQQALRLIAPGALAEDHAGQAVALKQPRAARLEHEPPEVRLHPGVGANPK